jgi:antitoxin component of MazEF toxin-antitoxin module
MDRKLTTQGPKGRQSYTVTLPIEWIKDHNLSKTKEISLEITGSSLIIKPKNKEVLRATLDANLLKEVLGRVVQILYKNGTDEIKITNIDPKTAANIHSIIETRCIGYEFTEQSKDSVKIEDISKGSGERFDSILRRCFRILNEMLNESDKSLLQQYDKNLNKLTAYAQRMLMKEGHIDYAKLPYFSRLVSELESFGDEIFHNQKSISEDVKYFDDVYELFYNFNELDFKKISSRLVVKRRGETKRLNSILGLIYALQGLNKLNQIKRSKPLEGFEPSTC